MSMELVIYVDGGFVSAKAGIGLLIESEIVYPQGVFESLRTYEGRIYRFKEHWLRLVRSAKMIDLELPIDEKDLEQAIYETIKRNTLKEAYIRVSLTKSSKGLASIQILTKSLPLYPDHLIEQGVAIATVTNRRGYFEALPSQIKSSNFLPNLLAKLEATQRFGSNYFETIMLNEKGFLTEGTISNIFMVKQGELLTPALYSGLLPGISRAVVMNLVKEMGFTVREGVLTRLDLYLAQEAFLTLTSIGILPVVMADGQVIGSGSPGEMTKQLRAAYIRDTLITREIWTR